MSSAKRRLKITPVDPSSLAPFSISPPNLVTQTNGADSSAYDFIRGDFTRKSAAKIMVIARLDFGSIRAELEFAVEGEGAIVPLTFIVGPANSLNHPMNQIPQLKTDILIQREPRGIYRVKIELDRAIYFRVDPKDLLKHTSLRQPHQIGILAAEKFLGQLSEGLQGSAQALGLASFGVRLKEQIESLEEKSKAAVTSASGIEISSSEKGVVYRFLIMISHKCPTKRQKKREKIFCSV